MQDSIQGNYLIKSSYLNGGYMPNITIEAVKLSNEDKNELIKSLTKVSSQITKIPESSFLVQIKEYPIENWGIGGVSLKTIIEKSNKN